MFVAYAGCYSPTFQDCAIVCTESVLCPGAMTCVAGYCTSGGTCADASTDLGDGSDAMAPVDGRTDLLDGASSDGGPSSIPNLVLWLEADNGIETASQDRVVQWRDQSGHNNHAVQPDVENSPAAIQGAINGYPAVNFSTPSWLVVVDTRSLQWGTDDFLLLIVGRAAVQCRTACEQQEVLFQKSEVASNPWNGPQLYLMRPEGVLRGYLTGTQDVYSTRGGFDDGAAHVFAVRRAALSIEVRVDGIPLGSQANTLANVDARGHNAYIGAHGVDGSRFQFEGDIAAIVAVDGKTTDADLMSLESYLLAKYAIAAP